MGRRRLSQCPACGELFPVNEGHSLTTPDGDALSLCSVDCLLDVYRRDHPAPADRPIEPPEDGGKPWPS